MSEIEDKKIPAEYVPITMWGYFGYELLFAIPVVGFVLLVILSFAAKNKNLKNFARSYFCYYIVIGIIAAIIIFIFVVFGGGAIFAGSLSQNM